MTETPDAARRRLTILAILALALVVLGSLFLYKWAGALRTVTRVEGARVYNPAPERIATAGLSALPAAGARTVNYLATVWPALLFGVSIAGLVRAFVSPQDVTRLLGTGVVRQQLIAGAVGMPLMLCSCCIAPVFSSVRASGARLSASLAVMLSSPSLNVASLVLTFLLFPRDIGIARVLLALFAVFGLPVVIERLAPARLQAARAGETGGPAEADFADPRQVIHRWAAASGAVAVRTLPWIVLGVFASALMVGSVEPSAHGAPAALSIAAVALFATLIALPTFFEIPLGLLLLGNGFPAGAAAAMLFAGPAINMPSLLTLARVSSGKTALLVFLAVWLTASLGGLALQFWGR